MRLFTGIDLPEEILERIARLLAQLRPTAQLKWSPVYNLHVTTRFIGEWPEARLPELTGALRQVPKRPRIPISIGGLGWFPNPHKPRVFWAGVKGGIPLHDLAKAIDTAIDPLGIERDNKEYSPHLTLARVKEAVPLQAVRQAIANLESVEMGAFEADRFYLYHSQPGAAGSVYSKLEQFPFAE